ncbi:MAG: hypothetical protein LBQ89_03160 [Treponema sp.]|jgi:hypothetical protein|nr:hypothetical protein [Treponema sp.]
MNGEKVMTSRGEVIAIGEFKIRNSKEFHYEIPRLSYIIIHEAENTYASTCIDLHIDGDGTTPDEAEANMGENVFEFLCVNFHNNRGDGPGWSYLKELFAIDKNTKETWDAFNNFKLDLARKGIKTDLASELMERVYVLKEEIDRLTNLSTTKEEELKVLRIWINKQKKEIERLNKEKQMIMEAAEKAVQLTALQFQTLRYFEMYNSNWFEKR